MKHKVKLDLFEGPLDLLLYLIRKNDIDIKNIPISEITEQYMEYVKTMEKLDLELVGDFLVMAATLMQIKSRMLLPEDPEEIEEAPDPRDELAQRLIEYERFKEAAGDLKEKAMMRSDLFNRMVDESTTKQIIDEAKEIYFEANLFDLINALSDAIKNSPEDVVHQIITEKFTVEQKIHDILHLLLDKETVMLGSLFEKARSKVEMIVTFLAILELIRLKEIKAVQKKIFSEIEVMRNKDNMIPLEQDEN
ncbi:Segregation and condensation protein A [hydrothermal vent metagenome]|uniref:Segregation and condensation protein A n=1 Tax=hydrothermal vent metagenome TaxID=652676 RepID=A0A3B0TQU3_9ZZZZ